MQTGESTSRAVGWSDVGSRAGDAPRSSLDDFGLIAPDLDDGWRGRDAASAGARQVPRVSATLIYLDPRTFTRDCIGRWLQSHLGGFSVCALPDPEQIMTLSTVGDETRAVIINTGPERMSSPGIASLMARVRELAPAVPVAVLSDYEDADNVRAAFELGVHGYIPTSLASGVAVQAVHLVCAGGTFAPAAALLSPSDARSGSDGAPLIDGFTQRQGQILDCLRRGMANKLIAYELNMCESTVKVHIRNIMKKLHATNRTQVVYLTNGLFETGGPYRRGD
ncbi:MAG: two component transcriptional regulator, LuxR family [Geminicoccaceae bacterium]|nr:two component transcriptional regulator, LuxR family [Geminicoccaceae bacterium]